MQNPSIAVLEEFKTIIGECISDCEALKFIKMGKGNLNLSLNYYFNGQAKKNNLNQSQSRKTVFSELMEGAKNQSKLEKIFNDLKKEYSKPIQSSITVNDLNLREKAPELKKYKTLDLNINKFQENTLKNDEKKRKKKKIMK